MKNVLFGAAVGLGVLAPSVADAFCGFYVSGADAKLFNDATQVVLMRDGNRTVLSMQNDYKGPPEDFALVVPVPVVLQKENVKTLAKDVFERVDKLTAPRLVEYWEQDPCPKEGEGLGTIGHGAGTGVGQGFGSGAGRLGGGDLGVKVEAQFEVGEYEIVILSAKDSSGLDTWLRENKYKIPENAEPALKPYVDAGSKFFVAKINVAKVKFEDGRASLSPLRFHYDTEKLELPVKLGLLNSGGTQDLIVYVIATDRYAVANYPNVTIPTNLDVTENARASFGAFYASLYDRTLERNPGAVVTEYAWQASSCDPCPGDTQGMTGNDLASLGADVMPNMRMSAAGFLGGFGRLGGSAPTIRQTATTVTGKLPPEVVQRIVRQNFGRFRLCYENGLRNNPNLQGKISVKFEIGPKGDVLSAKDSGSDLPDMGVVNCVTRGFSNLSFPEPEDHKNVSVVYPMVFSPGSGAPAPSASVDGGSTPPRPINVSSNKGPIVVTRLHARYGKSSLGSDLVFKVADPIIGGRESSGGAALEHGATITTGTSSFQARYAIRHPWQGPIACESPRRGVWGGPWPDAGASPGTMSATKLAYAPRGNVTLASFTTATAADLDGVKVNPDGGVTSAPDAGTVDPRSPSAPSSKCGCRVVGDEPSRGAETAFGVLLLGAIAAARRRR
jgi:MYXO-CTERM domain-containing protein